MDDRYLALLSDPRILRAALDTQPVMRRDAQGRDYWDRQPSYALDELVSMADTLDSENRVTAYLADRAMDAGLVRGTPEYLTALSFTPVLGTPQGVEDLRLMGQDVVDQTRAGNYGTAAAEAALTAAMVVPSLLGLGPAAKAAKGAVTDIANSPSVRRGVMDFLTDEFGGAGFRAYHGSPHDFDRFDLSKIGTGEGAQAYGHGLYFAENEDVARSYRDALASQMPMFQGQDAFGFKDIQTPRARAITNVANLMALGLTPERAFQRLMGDTDLSRPAASYEGIFPEDFSMNSGRMYEVQINADPNDFLDWDKPLSEQPQVLQRLGMSARPEDEIHDEALRLMTEGNAREPGKMWFDYPELQARIDELQGELDRRAPNMSGQEFYRGGADGDVSNILSQMGYGNPEVQTQALREAGIPGIRYLDAGSRGAREGSRNYVVFDDSMIEILRKYGLLAPTAGLGAYALGKPTEAQAAASGLLEDRR